MTRVLRPLTNRFSALLMCALLAAGCSHTPYSPASSTSLIATSILPAGALRTARAEIPEENPVVVCPGKGNADCEVNWRHLQEGHTIDEVASLLGQPTQQTGPDIYVEKVVSEWSYHNNGVVYFENEKLRYLQSPTSFEFPI